MHNSHYVPWENLVAWHQEMMSLTFGDPQIVLTNGAFDLLHIGHVSLLKRCRDLAPSATVLVAVNSDASVSRLKGPARPVNTVSDRVGLLTELACVDYVTVFEGDTIVELLKIVKPKFWVKGGDYALNGHPLTGQRVLDRHEVEAAKEVGAEICILPTLHAIHTTDVIRKCVN